ncbi:zinc ribbon domain-containing protein [uncultured Robinsoniella sp.]|uniref:zinc ribbon domain-containing protein n=1 Tax=uncultured Robinsoniella sp. TaxID=904190 RepID=UPI00374EC9E8
MTGDIFSSLMKGLSELMPEDDPCIRAFQLQSDIKKLKAKEDDIYKEVGKKALEQDGEIRFPEDLNKLLEARRQRQAAEEELFDLQSGRRGREEDDTEGCDEEECTVCEACGARNASDHLFCKECGAKLKNEGRKCPDCGNDVESDAKFCGQCGKRMG